MKSLIDLNDYYNKALEILEKNNEMLDKRAMALGDSFKRVTACLINESLVEYISVKKVSASTNTFKYWVIIFRKNCKDFEAALWVNLYNSPLLINAEGDDSKSFEYNCKIFVDPNEINPVILALDRSDKVKFSVVNKTSKLLEVLNNDYYLENVNKIIFQIENSIVHQEIYYNKSIKFIEPGASAISYEQSIVEGHHTHPMNKARFPIEYIAPYYSKEYNFDEINVFFYRVDKSEMLIYGDYERLILEVAKKYKIEYDVKKETIVMVHELQKHVVDKLFKSYALAKIPSKIRALSQCSLRSVNLPCVERYSFKLPLAITVSSAMRTITPWTIYIGPHLNEILDLFAKNTKHLEFLKEFGSTTIKHKDMDIAKNFGCIIREEADSKIDRKKETVVVCVYLTEKANINPPTASSEYNISKFFGLKTQKQKDGFGYKYAEMLLGALFSTTYIYGVSFEGHLQNVLVKVKNNHDTLQPPELLGFLVRDFGGIKVHQETLKSKTGLEVPVFNQESCVLAKDLEEVYKLSYHTLFHCHLQAIFRALDMHLNGKGWRFVLDYLLNNKEFMENERCKNFFLQKEAPFKCFFKMKLSDLYRDYLYSSVPNLITNSYNRKPGKDQVRYKSRKEKVEAYPFFLEQKIRIS